MARPLLLFAAVSLLSCQRSKPSPGESKPAASDAAEVAAPPSNVDAPDASAPASMSAASGERTSLAFHALKANAHSQLGPATARSAPYQTPTTTELAQVSFSRVTGGDGFFCGALEAGPLRCWGSIERTKVGAYVDVAQGAELVCGATTTGEVHCFRASDWEKQAIPTVSQVTRLAGAKSAVCALNRSGQVTCWGKDGSPTLQAPPDLKAKYIAAGDDFVCSGDRANQLVCWGATDGLALPAGPLLIKDLAAGARFVCVLTAAAELRCFGDAPKVEQATPTSISAGFETLCASSSTQSECAGAIAGKWEAPATRFAIGKSSVCAKLTSGLDCKGPAGAAELSVPRQAAAASAARAMTPSDFEAFSQLFPEASLPHALDQGASFSVGPRLPERYDPLFGDDATTFRAGVRFTLPSGGVAVTVLHLPTGEVELRTFSAQGVPGGRSTVAALEETRGVIDEDAAEAQQVRTAASVQSWLDAEGQLRTLRTTGREVTYFVTAHLDGSRPVSRRECDVSSVESKEKVEASGALRRLSAKVVPGKKSVGMEGCGDSWPGGT